MYTNLSKFFATFDIM